MYKCACPFAQLKVVGVVVVVALVVVVVGVVVAVGQRWFYYRLNHET